MKFFVKKSSKKCLQLFISGFWYQIMMILTLIKLLLFLAFSYFLLILIRMLIYIGRNASRREHDRASSLKDRHKKNEQGQTIELNKDQYKVE